MTNRLSIHLGNNGVIFPISNTNENTTITCSTSNGKHDVVSFPNMTTAVSSLVSQKEQHEQGETIYDYDFIDIYVNYDELIMNGGVWTNTMDLALLPMQSLTTTTKVTVHIVYKQTNNGDDSNNSSSNNNSNLQTIHTSFLLAGLQSTSETKREVVSDGIVYTIRSITAQKISSTSQPTSYKAIMIPKKQNSPTTTTTNHSTAVTISLDDDDNINNNDDLIDEDDLLQEETGDLAPPLVPTSTTNNNSNDCGGRTACDDCTCGRKDMEQQEQSLQLQQQQQQPTMMIKTSACGKCGLGDAFRCASCPYLGKPAFKAGEEHLVLELQDDF